jgi:hypothetical protein
LKLSDNEFYVMGIKASSYEYNVAWAAEKIGIEFDYQVPIDGGRWKPGGQVLDFDFHTTPLWTPVEVNGDYWHRDALTELRLEMAINDYFAGRRNKLEIMWQSDCDTPEHARQSLEDKLL